MRSSMLLAAAAFAALALPAAAETVNYKATILPSSEVPPVTNSQGQGELAATYDTASKLLSYGVTYSGLTGPATAAHFHGPAPVGKNAPVMVPINGDLASPIKGSATLTDEQAKALTDGDMYFNIHTAANKAGEMRGQVLKAN
ncbi:CHRD domain-containing protein [Lichenibacterium dinghuense]|uniref:CHRD domain-containing protein n=1 Tax=Lichenibacterium dinghuense TaxID=2895977 RepID=UPI001F23BEF8|nr:CHRD domain-containing protein [Lichenibacterium sp. 6Y81]